MTMLEENRIRGIEAADGRFFNDLDSRFEPVPAAGFFSFSRDFWGRYADILPNEHGLILQATLDYSRGQPSAQSRTAPEITSLYFDVQDRDAGVFGWHLTVATPGDGRTEHKITANPQKTEIRKASFDVQGRANEVAPDSAAAGLIMRLALGEEVVDQAKKLREMRAERKQELSRFSVEAIYKYSGKLYESKLKDLQDRADSTGFAQCMPFRW